MSNFRNNFFKRFRALSLSNAPTSMCYNDLREKGIEISTKVLLVMVCGEQIDSVRYRVNASNDSMQSLDEEISILTLILGRDVSQGFVL